jgi:hypothetical protein
MMNHHYGALALLLTVLMIGISTYEHRGLSLLSREFRINLPSAGERYA